MPRPQTLHIHAYSSMGLRSSRSLCPFVGAAPALHQEVRRNVDVLGLSQPLLSPKFSFSISIVLASLHVGLALHQSLKLYPDHSLNCAPDMCKKRQNNERRLVTIPTFCRALGPRTPVIAGPGQTRCQARRICLSLTLYHLGGAAHQLWSCCFHVLL